MRVYFWRSNNERILRCRRGKNSYRPLTIPPNVDMAEYTPLTHSTIELVDQGMVIGEAEIDSAVESTIMLRSTDNLEKVANESRSKESVDQDMAIEEEEIDPVVEPTVMLKPTDNLEKVANESTSKEPVDEQIGDESPTEDEDTMQPMVHESIDHAAALSGSVDVQVSSVAEGDDGYGSFSERGPESSPDGLHSGDDGMDLPQDRSGEEIYPVPSSDEDAGSDGL